MIERYSRKEIKSIWEEKNKYQIWLNIEIAAAEAMEKLKIIPSGVSFKVKKKARISVARIHKIESKVHHDVIAFLTSISEKVGHEARYLHKGITSSDILDTCFNIQLVQSSKILDNDLDNILKVLKNKSLKFKNTICIGRSHGIHAEPITFGLKLASFYEEFKRNKRRLKNAVNEISTCSISGAVGTFANVSPKVEAYVAKKLKLKPEPISTQVIPRDRHAYYFSVLGIIAASIERVSTEIRNLQKTELQEVEEFFDKKQKGSSAMPHKRNPILSENLTGLARMVRSYVTPALENVALWHERDISHSSVERNIGPDSTITLDFALNRLNNILKNMIVYPKKMKENLNLSKGLIFSQRVMLELTNHGFSREDAYRIVQKNAQISWKKNISFYECLSKDTLINKKISNKDLRKMFDINYHTKQINLIFKRVFE
jgi:adenylosuccinate lyase